MRNIKLKCGLRKLLTLRFKSGKQLPPLTARLTAETGALVDCVNKSKLKQLELTEDTLLRTGVVLGCANDYRAGG